MGCCLHSHLSNSKDEFITGIYPSLAEGKYQLYAGSDLPPSIPGITSVEPSTSALSSSLYHHDPYLNGLQGEALFPFQFANNVPFRHSLSRCGSSVSPTFFYFSLQSRPLGRTTIRFFPPRLQFSAVLQRPNLHLQASVSDPEEVLLHRPKSPQIALCLQAPMLDDGDEKSSEHEEKERGKQKGFKPRFGSIQKF